MISLIVLVAGYMVYGRVTERIFTPDDRQTPAVAINDGVDCVPMKTWKAFLVQLLNIAGTGPIFGALMGACFGPVVFLWIVFGSILGGAVHDYMSGMISCRHGGASVAELSGDILGSGMKWFMRVFSILLLVLTGTVFVTSPAALLTRVNFNVLWRYFSWSNQTLAMLSLWVMTAWLDRKGNHRFGSLITALPATFMSAVTVTYILMAEEGLRMVPSVAYPAGAVFAACLFAQHVIARRKMAERSIEK